MMPLSNRKMGAMHKSIREGVLCHIDCTMILSIRARANFHHNLLSIGQMLNSTKSSITLFYGEHTDRCIRLNWKSKIEHVATDFRFFFLWQSTILLLWIFNFNVIIAAWNVPLISKSPVKIINENLTECTAEHFIRNGFDVVSIEPQRQNHTYLYILTGGFGLHSVEINQLIWMAGCLALTRSKFKTNFRINQVVVLSVKSTNHWMFSEPFGLQPSFSLRFLLIQAYGKAIWISMSLWK